jgi:hypothetical protein
MMKHCLHDPEQEKEFDGQFTIYSCEFDNGERAKGNLGFIRIGEDGKIMLLLCVSCMNQIEGQILSPLFAEAIRHDKRIPEIVLNALKKNKVVND